MKLFEKYSNGLTKLIAQGNTDFDLDTTKTPEYFEKGIINENLELTQSNSKNKVLIDFDKTQLESLFGYNDSSFNEPTIGTHPDFEEITHHQYENHYCVSLFLDIKGSTRLNSKYNLREIRKIKDTILTLAIHVSNHFGGHVQRLQGDGIFIQFVRRQLSEQNAVINALNTSSVMTHFISNDLAAIFRANGVKPLTVRTGIDLGFKDDVIWSHYGVLGCSELTTTSLHTDLAAKLQVKAPSNGIYVGGNIKDILDIKPEFCNDIYKENGEVDYYIFQGNMNYRKYSFNWLKYLDSFDFTKISSSGNNIEIKVPNLRIRCSFKSPESENEFTYNQNSKALQKDSSLTYTLYENNHRYVKKSFETIEWRAFNSGQEAKDAEQLNHDFGKQSHNRIYCNTKAAYKGHHYVECIIKSDHSVNRKIKFSIFVE